MVIEKVKNTIKRHKLIAKGDKIVVAVSGGPDSVALLYLLAVLKKELNLTLHVAHLDHMLRRDSYKDREFVEGLAKKLRLPVTAARVNIKAFAHKGSIEEIARNARLGFLFRVARDIKADKICLGHTLDDQAETVLMRILRGTGLYGLSGILPKRNIAGYLIIRPLIEVRRKEIEAFLKRKKIKARQDPSNLEEVYFRNKIRNKLLPRLEKEYSANIKEILSNMAETIALDYDYLRSKADYYMRSFGRRINLKKFLRLHPAMQRLVLRMSIAKIKGDFRRITFQHIREIEDLILSRPVNSIVNLPRGVCIVKKNGYLSIYRKAANLT